MPPGHGFEPQPADAAHPQTEATVAAAGLGLRRKEVMHQDDVLHTVRVDVGDDDPERRRHLRQPWQRCSVKAAVALFEHDVAQFVALEHQRVAERLAVDVAQLRARELVVGREAFAHERHRLAAAAEPAHRQLAFGRDLALDDVERAVAVEVARIEPLRLLRRGLVLRVEAEVGGDEVDVAIAVEVAGGEAVPLPAQLREAERLRAVDEPFAALVAEHAHGLPRGGDDQVDEAVGIDVGPHRTRHHAGVAQAGRDFAGDVDEAATVVAQQAARPRLREAARHDARADEQVEIAVAVEVGCADTARAVAKVRQHAVGCARERPLAVVHVQAIAQQLGAFAGFDAAAGDVQVEVAVAIEVEEAGAEILAFGVVAPGAGDGNILAAREPHQTARLAGGSADPILVATVAVDVADRSARAEARQAVWQQRLQGVVVEVAFDVRHSRPDRPPMSLWNGRA